MANPIYESLFSFHYANSDNKPIYSKNDVHFNPLSGLRCSKIFIADNHLTLESKKFPKDTVCTNFDKVGLELDKKYEYLFKDAPATGVTQVGLSQNGFKQNVNDNLNQGGIYNQNVKMCS
jgi:hypothetical protein